MSKTAKILLISGALVLGCVAFVWFWFDSHTDDAHLNYIPADAAAVFSIHTLEIAAKVDPAKMESLKPVTQTVNDIPDFIVNLMTDPMATGIDPIQNIYGFVEKEKQSTVFALVVAVNDEDDFTAFAQKMFPGRTAEDLGSFHYLDIDDTRGLAWDKDAAIFVAVAEADVRAYTENLFALGKDGSIKTDTSFASFNAKSFDAGLWTNNNRLTVLNDQTSPLGLIGMNEGYSQFFLRFEQNEIVAEYVAPATTGTSIFKKEGPPAADLELLGTRDPLLYLGLNFDVKNLLGSAGNDDVMKDNVALMTGALGLTQDEMSKLFTGSVIVSVSDYRNITATDPRVQKEAQEVLGPLASLGGMDVAGSMLEAFPIEVPVTCISMGITDEQRTNEMMLQLGMKKMEEGFWAAPGVEMVIYCVVTPAHLVITNDYVSADAIQKNGKLPGKLPSDYAQKIPLQSFSLFMDLNKEKMPPLLLSPENPLLAAEDLASFVNLSDFLSSVRYESNATGSSFHFVLPESSDNSITRALKYMQPAP